MLDVQARACSVKGAASTSAAVQSSECTLLDREASAQRRRGARRCCDRVARRLAVHQRSHGVAVVRLVGRRPNRDQLTPALQVTRTLPFGGVRSSASPSRDCVRVKASVGPAGPASLSRLRLTRRPRARAGTSAFAVRSPQSHERFGDQGRVRRADGGRAFPTKALAGSLPTRVIAAATTRLRQALCSCRCRCRHQSSAGVVRVRVSHRITREHIIGR